MRIRSPRTVQQMQQLFMTTICSAPFLNISSASTPASANSFSITAMRCPCASRRIWLSSVVLPLPRKPVKIVTGTGVALIACLPIDG